MTPVQWLLNELKLEIHQLQEVLPLFQQALDMEVKQSQSDIMLGRNSIEISDEEIDMASVLCFIDYKTISFNEMFRKGAKWYREQLKQRK